MRLSIYFILICFLSLFNNVVFAQETKSYSEGNYRMHAGTVTELTLVYVGAYTCSPCREPSLKSALEVAKTNLHQKAKESGKQFSVIGIANDLSVEDGLEFLEESGYFDEIIVGKNFLNLGSIDLIWNEDSNDYAVPQIFVFEREITVDKDITVGPKTILATYSGRDEIEEWVNNGTSIVLKTEN